MKIGILTFHCAANYGAVLQAYGLQETLKSMGHEVHILDYRPEFLLAPYEPFKCRNIKSVKEIIRSIAVIPKRAKRLKHFKAFTKSKLNLIPFNNISDLDAIIVGSDQVWNPILNNGHFDTNYFLDLKLPKHILKISYAASAGSRAAFEKHFNSHYIELLNQFDYISVREKSLAEYLQNKTYKSISTVMDPVFLAGKNVFKRLINKDLVPKEEYILTFSLGFDPKVSKIGKQYAKKLKLISLDMVSASDSIGHKIVETATIQKFLSLIYYAKHIFTTSFHGTALAILFNKSFTSFGYADMHSERCRNLLLDLNISFNYKHIDEPLQQIDSINYDEVNHILSNLTNNSIGYLKNALS